MVTGPPRRGRPQEGDIFDLSPPSPFSTQRPKRAGTHANPRIFNWALQILLLIVAIRRLL